jgi:hypothetical protein
MNEELKEKYLQKMKDVAKNHDAEVAHCDADDLLCELLKDLGYEEIIEAFESVDKWYA